MTLEFPAGCFFAAPVESTWAAVLTPEAIGFVNRVEITEPMACDEID